MDYKIHKENLEQLKLKGVYLIRNLDNGLLKIGACSNLNKRFSEIMVVLDFVGLSQT